MAKNYKLYGQYCLAMLNAFPRDVLYCDRKRLHEAVGYCASYINGDNPPKLPKSRKSIREYLWDAMAAGLIDQPGGERTPYRITPEGCIWRDKINLNQDYHALGSFICHDEI